MMKKMKHWLSLINTALPFCLFGFYFVLLVMIGLSFPGAQEALDSRVAEREVLSKQNALVQAQRFIIKESHSYMANR